MALGKSVKTEHAGAKNGDKRYTRAEVKNGGKKIRRREDKRQVRQ